MRPQLISLAAVLQLHLGVARLQRAWICVDFLRQIHWVYASFSCLAHAGCSRALAAKQVVKPLLVLVLAAGWVCEVSAGAWAQAPGHYYTKVSGIFYSSEEVFNDMGKRAPMGMDQEQFYARQTFVYGEYGLRERLTLTGQFSAGRLVAEDRFIERVTKGLGDVQLGVKYQLKGGGLVVSPLVELKLPTGYDSAYTPALGTGDPDLEVRILSGLSLYPLPFYTGAEVGYKLRGGPFSNQVSYVIEVGATPHPRLFAKIFYNGVNTLSDALANAGLVGVVQISEGDFANVGFNAAARLAGPLWLDFLWAGVVSGKNIGAGSSWGLGLVLIH